MHKHFPSLFFVWFSTQEVQEARVEFIRKKQAQIMGNSRSKWTRRSYHYICILSYSSLLKCSIHTQLQRSAQMQYTYSVTAVCSNTVYILNYRGPLKHSIHTQLQRSTQTQYTYSITEVHSNTVYILNYRGPLKHSIHTQLQRSTQTQYTYSITEVHSNTVYILNYRGPLKHSIHTQLQRSTQTQYTYSITEVHSNTVYILNYRGPLKHSIHTQLQRSTQTQYTYSITEVHSNAVYILNYRGPLKHSIHTQLQRSTQMQYRYYWVACSCSCCLFFLFCLHFFSCRGRFLSWVWDDCGVSRSLCEAVNGCSLSTLQSSLKCYCHQINVMLQLLSDQMPRCHVCVCLLRAHKCHVSRPQQNVFTSTLPLCLPGIPHTAVCNSNKLHTAVTCLGSHTLRYPIAINYILLWPALDPTHCGVQ